jgi:hypothetical protein
MSQQHHLDKAAIEAILNDTGPWNETTHGPLLTALEKKYGASLLELNALLALQQKKLVHTSRVYEMEFRYIWFGAGDQ